MTQEKYFHINQAKHILLFMHKVNTFIYTFEEIKIFVLDNFF